MISITVDDKAVRKMIAELPKKASRAAEQALDFTAVRIADEVRTQMLRRFDNPTQYTLNSLKVQKTRGHNMLAIVSLKEPERMADHYLLSEVEGGKRKLKGFERGLGMEQFVPGAAAQIDASGNVKVGQIRAALRDVKANNHKKYFYNKKRTGKLWPGVYQKVKVGKRYGIKPIIMLGKTGAAVRPLLPFYAIAQAEYTRRFLPAFTARFNAMVR